MEAIIFAGVFVVVVFFFVSFGFFHFFFTFQIM